MALATSSRVSEIHGLSKTIGFKEGNAVISFMTSFRAKTDRDSSLPRALMVKGLKDLVGSEQEGLLCPIRILKFYLERTKISRGDVKSLFCSVKRPNKSMTKNAISYYLRKLIKEALVNFD